MEIFPMNVALIHADRRTKIKQMCVSATIPESIKIYCERREGGITRQHQGCAKSLVSRRKCCLVTLH